MMKRGRKKFDRWVFKHEGQEHAVDVAIIRPLDDQVGKTTFLATNAELEIRIEDANIDALRNLAKAAVLRAASATWSRWIQYTIERDEREIERGNVRAGLKVSWILVDRTDIGKPTERHRDIVGAGNPPHYGRICHGAPEVGFTSSYRGEDQNTFCGLIPYSKEVEKGLDVIAEALSDIYVKLSAVLLTNPGADDAKFLIWAGHHGKLQLPEPPPAVEKKGKR